jgi:hypothetical protein
MMEPEGRVFIKSEFGPIADRWPCFSYTKANVGARLQSEYKPGRDIVIYCGTSSAKTTEDPDHRSRLISAITIQPKHILETRKIVPEEQWKITISEYGDNPWPYSMAVIDAAVMIGPPFPEARTFTPVAYSSLGAMENRGNVVEAVGAERSAVMALAVERIQLNLSEPVRKYLGLMSSISDKIEKTIKQEALRMAMLIQDRVKSGGEYSLRLNPMRTAPNLSDLAALIIRKWTVDQMGMCALCGGRLTRTANKMLQASADRIDSTNIAYDDANTQVTHLACNLAKNQYGSDVFAEWVSIVRGSGEAGLETAR